MDKSKNDKSKQNSRNMLDQKTGSMLDKKTNEDFNNEHPDHNNSGEIKGFQTAGDKNRGKYSRQKVDKKNIETK